MKTAFLYIGLLIILLSCSPSSSYDESEQSLNKNQSKTELEVINNSENDRENDERKISIQSARQQINTQFEKSDDLQEKINVKPSIEITEYTSNIETVESDAIVKNAREFIKNYMSGESVDIDTLPEEIKNSVNNYKEKNGITDYITASLSKSPKGWIVRLNHPQSHLRGRRVLYMDDKGNILRVMLGR